MIDVALGLRSIDTDVLPEAALHTVDTQRLSVAAVLRTGSSFMRGRTAAGAAFDGLVMGYSTGLKHPSPRMVIIEPTVKIVVS